MFSTDNDTSRADWPFLQNGAITLFWKPALVADAKRELAGLKYEIADVYCTVGDPSFEEQLSDLLQWEKQFGYGPWTGGLDALADGLRGFPFGVEDRNVIVLNGFDRLVARDPTFAHEILDIFECAARDHLLWSKLLIVLVQTNDPTYACPPVGCRSVTWNRREWMNADRRI